MARNVILDVDTGSDDACAIMLAALSEELNVLGVCAVNGNRPLSDTLTNTLKIIELLKMEDKIRVQPSRLYVTFLQEETKIQRLLKSSLMKTEKKSATILRNSTFPSLY